MKKVARLENEGIERDKYFRIKILEYSGTFDRLEVQMDSLQEWAEDRLIAAHSTCHERTQWVEDALAGGRAKVEQACDFALSAMKNIAVSSQAARCVMDHGAAMAESAAAAGIPSVFSPPAATAVPDDTAST